MKTGEWSKKLVAIVIVGGLIFSPFLVLAQSASELMNPDYLDFSGPSQNPGRIGTGDSASELMNPDYLDFSNPDQSQRANQPNAQQASAQRSKKDQEKYQQDAKKLEELQKKDEQDCDGKGGGGGSNPLEQVLTQGGKQIIEEQVKKSVETAAKKAVEETIKTEVPKVIKESIQTELPQYLKAQLPEKLKLRLQAEKALGTDLTNKETVKSIINQEIKKVVSAGIPAITKNAIGSKLPKAISQNLGANIALGVSTDLSQKLPQAFADKLPGLLDRGLSDQINSFLQDSLTGTEGVDNDTINSLGDNLVDQITQSVSDTLDDSMDQLTNGITDAVAGSMDEIVGTITDSLTDSLDQITGTIMGSLNDSLDQIAGSITSSLNNSINEITDSIMEPLNESLNQITDSITKPITDAMSDITDSITKPITEAMSSITDSITKPITEAMSSITDSITKPITDVMSNITDSITKPFTDVISNVTSGITGSISNIAGNAVSGLTGGLVGGATNAITGAATGAVGGVVGGAVGGVAGGIVGGALGFGFVPVKEQNGPLMTAAQNTDKNTKEIWDLSKKICMYTKAIKRIQQAFEKQQFVDNPDVRRTASSKINDYRNQLQDFANKGYDSTGQGPDSPIYPKNIAEHLKEVRDEQAGLTQETIKKSSNLEKDEVAKQLDQEEQISFQDQLKSTISKTDLNKLKTDPKAFSEADLWKNIALAARPENYFLGSYTIAKQQLNRAQNNAEQNSREELVAGNGFLPTRQCLEKQGQYCSKWSVVTPPSIVQQTMGDSMQARLNEYIQAKEYGDIGTGNEPTAAEVQNFAPVNTGGGGGGGSNAGSSREGGSALDLSQLFGGGGGNGGGGSDLSDLLGQLGGGGGLGDLGDLIGVSATINLDESGAKPKISWAGKNAVICRADNLWYSQGTGGTLSIVKNVGQILPASGSIEINTPISIPVALEITQGSTVYNLASTTSASGNLKNIAFNLATDPIYHPQTGDKVKLTVFGQSLSYTAQNAGAADIVTGLQSAVKALPADSAEKKAFDNLTISFYSNLGKISTTPKISYQIKCSGALGKQATGVVNLQ